MVLMSIYQLAAVAMLLQWTCEKAQEWQLALGLLSTMAADKMEANAISCRAALTAREKAPTA